MTTAIKIKVVLGCFVVYMWDKIVATFTGYHTLGGVAQWLLDTLSAQV